MSYIPVVTEVSFDPAQLQITLKYEHLHENVMEHHYPYVTFEFYKKGETTVSPDFTMEKYLTSFNPDLVDGETNIYYETFNVGENDLKDSSGNSVGPYHANGLISAQEYTINASFTGKSSSDFTFYRAPAESTENTTKDYTVSISTSSSLKGSSVHDSDTDPTISQDSNKGEINVNILVNDNTPLFKNFKIELYPDDPSITTEVISSDYTTSLLPFNNLIDRTIHFKDNSLHGLATSTRPYLIEGSSYIVKVIAEGEGGFNPAPVEHKVTITNNPEPPLILYYNVPATPTVHRTLEVVLQDIRVSSPYFNELDFKFINTTNSSNVITATLGESVQQVVDLSTYRDTPQKFLFTNISGTDAAAIAAKAAFAAANPNVSITYDCAFLENRIYKLEVVAKNVHETAPTLKSPKVEAPGVQVRVKPTVSGNIRQDYKDDGKLVLVFDGVTLIDGDNGNIRYVRTEVKDGDELEGGGMTSPEQIILTSNRANGFLDLPAYAITNDPATTDFKQTEEHTLVTQLRYKYPDSADNMTVKERIDEHTFDFKPKFKGINVISFEVDKDDSAFKDNGTITDDQNNVHNFFKYDKLTVNAKFEPITEYTRPFKDVHFHLFFHTGVHLYNLHNNNIGVEEIKDDNGNVLHLKSSFEFSNASKILSEQTHRYSMLGKIDHFYARIKPIYAGSITDSTELVSTPGVPKNNIDKYGVQEEKKFTGALLDEFGESLSVSGTQITYKKCGVVVTDIFYHRRQHHQHYHNDGHTDAFAPAGANGSHTVQIPNEFTSKSSINSLDKETSIFIVYKSLFTGNKGFKHLKYTPLPP